MRKDMMCCPPACLSLPKKYLLTDGTSCLPSNQEVAELAAYAAEGGISFDGGSLKRVQITGGRLGVVWTPPPPPTCRQALSRQPVSSPPPPHWLEVVMNSDRGGGHPLSCSRLSRILSDCP